jgi:hypothetical protein
MLPRAATSPELARIRLDGQWGEMLACIPTPATVYTALVNGTPTGTDQLTQITYDGGAGTLGNVLPGMTLFVGSVAGGYDKGQARIRKAPTSTIFYIGTESDINVLDEDYLTVVDEQGIWEKQVRIASSIYYMDYDVAYTNQNASRLPVVVMGGPVILELVGATVTAVFDASNSWVPGGGAATYLWTAPGAASSTGLTTATPTMTYNAAGRYRVSCQVTIGGVANIRYEWVQVFDATHPPITQFQVRSITGAKAQGGYTLQMTLYAQGGLPEGSVPLVRDRAQVMIFTRDHFGTAGIVPTGYATGRENILVTGWIAGESIVWSPELSTVTFTVEGAYAWLGRITAYPEGLQDVTTTPATWKDYNTLTTTGFLWHLLTWRSTVAQAIDCLVEISTTRIIEMSAAATSLWEQINVTAGQRFLADPVTDHLSRLFVKIGAQRRADRSSVVEVMTLLKQDWKTPITLTRNPVAVSSMVDLNGFKWDGTAATALFSLSPGRTWKRYGRVQAQQGLWLDSQAQANTLAGLLCGEANNEYPSVQVQLAANNRFLDIAPDCYVKLTLAPADTPRGVSFTNKRFIPRRISWAYDAASGGLLPTVDLEAETFAELGVTGDAPATEPIPPILPPPTGCPTGYHPDPTSGLCVPNGGTIGTGDLVYVFANGKLGRSRNFIVGGTSVTWEDVTGVATGSGTGTAFILDPWGPKAGAYLCWQDALWHTGNLDASPPTWTSILMAATVQTEKGVSSVVLSRLSGSITESGLVYVAWTSGGGTTKCGVSVSADSGATWSHYFVENQNGGMRRIIADMQISGEVWLDGANNGNDQVKVSTDHGATWGGVFGPRFTVVTDFDISYPDAAVAVAQDDAGGLWYSHSGGAWIQQSGTLVMDTGGFINMNIATQDKNDVLYAGGGAIWHSTDGGVNWTNIANLGGSGCSDRKLVALGRWPYDANRVFWLWCPGGVAPPAELIAYSADLMVTVQNKMGNWNAVMGTFGNPVMIVPVWVA